MSRILADVGFLIPAVSHLKKMFGSNQLACGKQFFVMNKINRSWLMQSVLLTLAIYFVLFDKASCTVLLDNRLQKRHHSTLTSVSYTKVADNIC
jgi:hypothetical protein